MSLFWALRHFGLTNNESEDYGSFASSEIEKITFAFCCDEFYYSQYGGNKCEYCSHALMFRTKELPSFLELKEKVDKKNEILLEKIREERKEKAAYNKYLDDWHKSNKV